MIWTFDHDTPRIVNYLGYPGNYGMIPRAFLPKNLGGDGDPLDVLLLGPSIKRGPTKWGPSKTFPVAPRRGRFWRRGKEPNSLCSQVASSIGGPANWILGFTRPSVTPYLSPYGYVLLQCVMLGSSPAACQGPGSKSFQNRVL